MIIINFKTYAQATTGSKPVKLARIAQSVHLRYHIPIIICAQATDIFQLSQAVSVPIYAQHIDPIDPGQSTGFISALAVKQDGAKGVLLNHSEHRLNPNDLTTSIQKARENRLKVVVCAETSQEAQRIDTLNVDAIALEDPALIGGDVSIVTSQSGRRQIQEFVSLPLKAQKLIGAGIKARADVEESLYLGAQGVLIASGFVKADNPKKVLQNLCKGFSTIPH